MNAPFAIGIDIGGTRTKYGLVDLETGTVKETLLLNTEKENSEVFLEQTAKALNQFKHKADKEKKSIAGIGIGIPGFTTKEGIVATTYGFLPFMENYAIKRIIENTFSLPCLIDNDARIVALGEALYGKGKGYERVLTLTLGTGVGFGFVVNGKFIDPIPLAHMGGHMQITDTGGECYCGKTGCLEALVSSTGILQLAEQYKPLHFELTVEAIFAASAHHHLNAIQLIEKVTSFLHTGIHNYANLFAPDIIVLGGGVAKSLLPYVEKIKGKKYSGPYEGYDFELTISQLEEQAGILGSAALFLS